MSRSQNESRSNDRTTTEMVLSVVTSQRRLIWKLSFFCGSATDNSSLGGRCRIVREKQFRFIGSSRTNCKCNHKKTKNFRHPIRQQRICDRNFNTENRNNNFTSAAFTRTTANEWELVWRFTMLFQNSRRDHNHRQLWSRSLVQLQLKCHEHEQCHLSVSNRKHIRPPTYSEILIFSACNCDFLNRHRHMENENNQRLSIHIM